MAHFESGVLKGIVEELQAISGKWWGRRDALTQYLQKSEQDVAADLNKTVVPQ